jgi:diguanylate cyclase (GGDEF)-like protein
MSSILGRRSPQPEPSPLEGLPEFRVRQVEESLRQLGRHELWLWISAFLVTVLSITVFLLSSIPSFFQPILQQHPHFYEIRSDEARWGVLCLLLLFNTWAVYRQWVFRCMYRQLTGKNQGPMVTTGLASEANGIDPQTGLYNRAFAEQQLAKEIARAKRNNSALSLATVHLDEYDQLNARYGATAADLAMKELGRRLKRSCRGSDFAVRLAQDDFLLVLPECGLGEVKIVLNRLGSLEMNCGGRTVNLVYTTGWVDYQPGDMPSDLLQRAAEILHLYEDAAKASFATTPAPH